MVLGGGRNDLQVGLLLVLGNLGQRACHGPHSTSVRSFSSQRGKMSGMLMYLFHIPLPLSFLSPSPPILWVILDIYNHILQKLHCLQIKLVPVPTKWLQCYRDFWGGGGESCLLWMELGRGIRNSIIASFRHPPTFRHKWEISLLGK